MSERNNKSYLQSSQPTTKVPVSMSILQNLTNNKQVKSWLLSCWKAPYMHIKKKFVPIGNFYAANRIDNQTKRASHWLTEQLIWQNLSNLIWLNSPPKKNTTSIIFKPANTQMNALNQINPNNKSLNLIKNLSYMTFIQDFGHFVVFIISDNTKPLS